MKGDEGVAAYLIQTTLGRHLWYPRRYITTTPPPLSGEVLEVGSCRQEVKPTGGNAFFFYLWRTDFNEVERQTEIRFNINRRDRGSDNNRPGSLRLIKFN